MSSRNSAIPSYAHLPLNRRRGLFSMILGLDAGFRQRKALERLDADRLRDIGIAADDVHQETVRPAWNAPNWWR